MEWRFSMGNRNGHKSALATTISIRGTSKQSKMWHLSMRFWIGWVRHQLLLNNSSKSSQQQGSSSEPITEFISNAKEKFHYNIICLQACLGFLKVGSKHLFHRDFYGQIKEIQPLCLLDFYVHESVQRVGIGKQLFESMLINEKLEPH
jgi:hypothetical protein